MKTQLAISAAFFLAACPSPPDQATSQQNPAPQQPAAASQAGPAEAGTKPEAQAAPQPAGGGGASTTLSGTVTYGGKAEGGIHLDVLVAQDEPGFSPMVASTVLDAPGEWKLDVPQGQGKLVLVAYVDPDKDGPTPGDPLVTSCPFDPGEGPIADIEIDLPASGDVPPDVKQGEEEKPKEKEEKCFKIGAGMAEPGPVPRAGAEPAQAPKGEEGAAAPGGEQQAPAGESQ